MLNGNSYEKVADVFCVFETVLEDANENADR